MSTTTLETLAQHPLERFIDYPQTMYDAQQHIPLSMLRQKEAKKNGQVDGLLPAVVVSTEQSPEEFMREHGYEVQIEHSSWQFMHDHAYDGNPEEGQIYESLESTHGKLFKITHEDQSVLVHLLNPSTDPSFEIRDFREHYTTRLRKKTSQKMQGFFSKTKNKISKKFSGMNDHLVQHGVAYALAGAIAVHALGDVLTKKLSHTQAEPVAQEKIIIPTQNPAPTIHTKETLQEKAHTRSYQVRAQDNIWTIAKKEHPQATNAEIVCYVNEIAELNGKNSLEKNEKEKKLGHKIPKNKDTDYIRTGQLIKLPSQAKQEKLEEKIQEPTKEILTFGSYQHNIRTIIQEKNDNYQLQTSVTGMDIKKALYEHQEQSMRGEKLGMLERYDHRIASEQFKEDIVASYKSGEKTLETLSRELTKKYGMHISSSTISKYSRKELGVASRREVHKINQAQNLNSLDQRLSA